jgi:hypothetical protein
MARSTLVGDAKKEQPRTIDRHSALLSREAQEKTLVQPPRSAEPHDLAGSSPGLGGDDRSTEGLDPASAALSLAGFPSPGSRVAESDSETQIHLIAGQESVELPAILPVLPVRDVVVFPGVTVPLAVGREKSLAALEENHRCAQPRQAGRRRRCCPHSSQPSDRRFTRAADAARRTRGCRSGSKR